MSALNSSKVPANSSNSKLSSSVRKALVLSALSIQNTALILVTKLSYGRRELPYLTSVVVACSEGVKLVLSCMLLACTDGRHAAAEAISGVVFNLTLLLIPCVLYVLQNNLLFKGIKLLSPTAYVVCSQSKILTSAFWSVVMLKTKITLKQYVALIVLVFGMFMVQTDEAKQRETSSEKVEANGSVIEGSLIVLAAAVTSGFAGTYLEKMYKEGLVLRRTVWYRNTQLACLSLPIAVLVAYWQDSWLINTNGWFQGYDLVVWGIIALQALGGLIVATVLRYAGNVLKCFAVSVSICACALSTSLSHTDTHYLGLHANVVIGIILVIGSTFLYCDAL